MYKIATRQKTPVLKEVYFPTGNSLRKICVKTKQHIIKLFFIFLTTATALSLCSCKRQHNLTLQGYVDGTYTYVSSAVAGTLRERPIAKGDIVKKNQFLFQLDPEPERSQLEVAKQNLVHSQQLLADLQKGGRTTIIDAIAAQRAQASAELNLAKTNLKRYQTLYQSHTIDKATLDSATTTYQTAHEKLKEIEAHLAEAKLGGRENAIAAQKALVASNTATVEQATWALAQKTVYSPSEALVFDTLHEPGEFIPTGNTVAVLLPRYTLKIIFFVPQVMLSRIRIGEKINFSCDGCDATYNAHINFISPDPEYTPPVIFSKETRNKLVYRIEAKIATSALNKINIGQPVDVVLLSSP